MIRQIFVVLSSYICAVWFNLSIDKNSTSDIITYFSILVGFFLSALAILYASPLRKTLSETQYDKQKDKWTKTVDEYKNVSIFSIFSILMLLVKLPSDWNLYFEFYGHDMLQADKFYLALVISATISFIYLVNILFKNMKVEIND